MPIYKKNWLKKAQYSLKVNAFLAENYDDFAILRRYLVDNGYLSRDQYGLEYRIEEKR